MHQKSKEDDTTVEHDERGTLGVEALDMMPSYGPDGVRGLFSSGYVLGAACLASLGGFSFGYDQGVTSVINVMPQFHAAIPQAESEFGKGFMTGMLLLGAFVGCIFMPYLADKVSRKWALTVVVIIFDIGAIIQTSAQSYGMLVAGRAIGGIGVGTLAMGAPLYISEISPPNLRGTLLVLESICLVSGSVIAYWIKFGMRLVNSEASFRVPFGLQMVSATLVGIGIHFFPYSPRWLALVDRPEDCLKSLSRLRGLPLSDQNVQAEFNAIISEREALIWMDLFKPQTWKRTAVGVGVGFFQQFSGEGEMSLILSGVFNSLQLLTVLVCFFTIDKVGRRPLAILGGFLMGACYVVIAVLMALYGPNWANPSAGWACVAMAFLYILVYGNTYSPLGWALPSEVFPNALRSKGVALSTCVNWLSNFIVGIVTPAMMANIGYGTYVFFAACCALAGTWAFFLVPETTGRTLEEIVEVFGNVSKQAHNEITGETTSEVVREANRVDV
ncbi:sugar porter family MFS transporter [Aspergillus neoniger CBS 115656]|uniref:MFS monosaccharide transporter n=1 Tax=Aspergillus neoniger (strain CBS 115656) TaxID=1448310 RepID=A0A318YAD2_ASPNB|nr:MFS monosaccharide transporter [Aspergillus neoniger CBS 115656]PYH31305.1 MFS monosaccharide transporter [Aspergillus neoniger CBS 115656]